MLLENSALPMNKQQEIFSQTFNEWKNGNAQIDDVLLIGFSI